MLSRRSKTTRQRQCRSYTSTTCGCGRLIPPGEWYNQHFDANGLFFKITCKECESNHA